MLIQLLFQRPFVLALGKKCLLIAFSEFTFIAWEHQGTQTRIQQEPKLESKLEHALLSLKVHLLSVKAKLFQTLNKWESPAENRIDI